MQKMLKFFKHGAWEQRRLLFIFAFTLVSTSLIFLIGSEALANIPRLPGIDQSNKLTAAGSLLRIIDSFLFKFGARILAGLSVLAAGWNLKEQRFAMAIICILAAIVIGTAPMWVKNIFEMGGGTLFSFNFLLGGSYA